ncbi:hypothetical protein ACVWW9_002082 [Agrococcus sp. UYP33]
MAMDINDLVSQLLEMQSAQISLQQELATLRQDVSGLPAADVTDQLERAMLRVWTRGGDSGPTDEQRALMDWFGEMRERLGHADPSFYLSVTVDPRSGDAHLQGPGLAFADAVRIGELELQLPANPDTEWNLTIDQVVDQGVALPADIVVFRGGRTVARGVLPAA